MSIYFEYSRDTIIFVMEVLLMEQQKYRVNKEINMIPANENEIILKQGIFSQSSNIISDEGKSGNLIKIIHFLENNYELTEKDLEKIIPSENERKELIEFLLANELILSTENVQLFNGMFIVSNIDRLSKLDIFETVSENIDIEPIENYKNFNFNKHLILIVIADRYLPRLFHEMNEWAIRNNVPMQISFLDDRQSFILPVFKPHFTTCFNEVEIHLEASMKNVSQMLVYKDFLLKNGNNKVAKDYDLIVHSSFVLSNIATFVKNRYEKNILTVLNLKTMEIEKVKIYKLPYCNACNQDTEYTHIFL